MANHTKKQITEHGISMYRQRGCRCDTCKAAAREERIRYRPLKPRAVTPRVDGNIFVDRLVADRKAWMVHASKLNLWRREGITIWSADSWAIKLGYHPSEIWGSSFYVGAFDEELSV